MAPQRTLGVFPASVGTALMMEELMARPTEKIEVLYFNLSTVFRNVYQAYKTEDHDKLKPQQLFKDMVDDLTQVYDHIDKIGTVKNITLHVYSVNYVKLNKHYPHANLWYPVKDKQKKLYKLMMDTLALFLKVYDKSVIKVDNKVPFSHKENYVVTHHPVDLIDIEPGVTVKLLESHTGRVKTKSLWSTKLTNGNSLTRIPFNKLTLQVFGDNSVDFKASSLLMRSTLLRIAEENKWTASTTKDRINLGISMINDPELKAAFKQLW